MTHNPFTEAEAKPRPRLKILSDGTIVEIKRREDNYSSTKAMYIQLHSVIKNIMKIGHIHCEITIPDAGSDLIFAITARANRKHAGGEYKVIVSEVHYNDQLTMFTDYFQFCRTTHKKQFLSSLESFINETRAQDERTKELRNEP